MGPFYFSNQSPSVKDSKGASNVIISNDTQAKISSEEAFVEAYIEIINFLKSKGKKVIFVVDQPELDFDRALCRTRLMKFTQNKDLMCNLPCDIIEKNRKKYQTLISNIKRRVPSLTVYDPMLMFCEQNIFHARKGDISLYADSNHLSCKGSELLSDHFQEWFNEQIKKNF